MSSLGVVLLLSLLPLHLDLVPVGLDHVSARGVGGAEVVVLQEITDDLRTRLQIPEQVHVTLVEHNPLVLSVETLAGRTGPFVITIDRGFINQLSREEAEAAVAHELGHVWIYTHHPYLQTERLANDIAMRVINRSAFEPVYKKVWERTGIAGNLIEFLGPPSQQ
jgi:Zn-dependent protease with chaperone function